MKTIAIPFVFVAALMLSLFACPSKPPCSAETCGGCCKEDQCLNGTDLEACGVQGAACDVCLPSQMCNGTCMTKENLGGGSGTGGGSANTGGGSATGGGSGAGGGGGSSPGREAGGQTPADGATGAANNQRLTWYCGSLSNSANLFLGTVSPPPSLKNAHAGSNGSFEYTQLSGLAPETKYYWRVDCIYPGGTVTGPIWSFTTTCSDVFAACNPSTVMDADGNSYPTLNVCGACWMGANLRVGATAPLSGMANVQLDNNTAERICVGNDAGSCAQLGGLYNWNEAMNYSKTTNGLCPTGWRLPTDAEWQALERVLGIDPADLSDTGPRGFIAAKLTGASSSSHFDVLFPGYVTENFGVYDFVNVGVTARFWTSTASGANAWARELTMGLTAIRRQLNTKNDAHSIRCVKN